MNLSTILNKKEVKKDENGIWITNISLNKQTQLSKKSWERIYDLNLKQLLDAKKEFNESKLLDHVNYLLSTYKFNSKTVYLEIGCGPAYIGEYLMKKYDCYFIGVDFNYQMLITLKKYFDTIEYKKYILIHSDITTMPIKEKTVDYIYGGGVIEHLSNTNKVIKELRRVLKKDGISFNTVPAFNFWWILRFWNNIPYTSFIKEFFEFIHINILRGKILDKYFGYELSFLLPQLIKIHEDNGFSEINAGQFVFHPSTKKLKNKFLRWLYVFVTSNKYLSPVYYVYGKNNNL